MLLRLIRELFDRYKQCNNLPLRFKLLKTVRIEGVTYPEGAYWYHIHDDLANFMIYRDHKRKEYRIDLKLFNKFRTMKIVDENFK